MTKIMLVEDDKSLREIYGVRLLAEGYDIVSAGDGEEALAMAIKERPQLIVSDVMMPKISGFDLLDILRSTTETKNIRVIMMTALSSEDQRQRGEQLGADRYLVKSQVGIEDVVRVVHEVLEDQVQQPTASTPAPAPFQSAPAAPVAQPATPTPPASVQSIVTPTPVPQTAPQPATNPIPPPAGSNPLPMPSTTPQPVLEPPQARSKVITPINDPTVSVNLDELLNKEIAKEAGLDLSVTPTVQSSAQEQAQIKQQMSQFAAAPLETIPSATNTSAVPSVSIDDSGAASGAAIEPTENALPAPTPPAPTPAETPNNA
jgi:CheY-like chemotaxis protein